VRRRVPSGFKRTLLQVQAMIPEYILLLNRGYTSNQFFTSPSALL